MLAKAALPAPNRKWASHPAYARYWRHYHQAMTWMRSHQLAYWKAQEAYYNALWYCPPEDAAHVAGAGAGSLPQSCGPLVGARAPKHSSSQSRRAVKSRPPRKAQLEEPRSVSSSSLSSAWLSSSSDSEGIECDVSNMEITQELRDYFAQTEKHQEERKRQQLLEEKRLEDYVNADHDLYYNRQRSVEPPNDRAWERRLADMKRLYGDHAVKIQAMEAAMQLSFDKYCDQKQPKYWPVIPLKF